MIRCITRLLAVGWCLVPALSWADPVVTFGSATVRAGDTANIGVSISGVDPTVGLVSWQFDLLFKPAIVSALSVTEGPFLSGFGSTLFSPGIIDNAGGVITLVANSFVDIGTPSGSGVLATISFTALANGTTALTPSNVFLNFIGSGFSVQSGTIDVASVPVPEADASALLAFGALLTLLGSRAAKPSSTVPIR